MKLVFSTHNQHKLREIKALLPPNIQLLSLEDIGCGEDIPETATTIEGNALLKVQYIQKHYHTGLEVQALNNAPGVYSARYAGEHKSDADNMQLLLRNMEGISHREAQFKTVIALCLEAVVYTFEGIAKGTIGTTPIGTNGFGYDPIFIPENSDKTFAELTQDEKNRISHRGKAFEKLLDFLNQKIQ